MPSVQDPRHFETGALMPARYDPFFRWICGDSENVTGDVESPGGFVTLAYVDASAEIEEYIEQFGFSTFSESDTQGVTTGWYVTLVNDQGLIWAFSFGDGTMAEENARKEFKGSQEYYDWWLDQPVFGS